ncbi:hypothetical protein [Alkalinema sp. FACHB-956]|uniref:hypothetical protein n=1 Tax=Alkalinema sp. FACHB-956 TaxID=2692768 RepID=UPI001681F009|nr:hypothetical protein [Alkalinema sp. FACHB-956]MBD2325401.1 hypothetical protein [Alkalinema sp. FACHB-956]
MKPIASPRILPRTLPTALSRILSRILPSILLKQGWQATQQFSRRIITGSIITGSIITGSIITVLAITACTKPSIPVDGTWEYREFIQQVETKQVEKVSVSSDRTQAIATRKDGQRFLIHLSKEDPNLITTLTQHGVDISVLPSQ